MPGGVSYELVGDRMKQYLTATPNHVLRGMDMTHLGKNDHVLQELRDKGMAPPAASKEEGGKGEILT
jgi:hypothetical protein